MSRDESDRAVREADPETYTFEGVRRIQAQEFSALSLGEKLRAAESMSDLARYFQERRKKLGPLIVADARREDCETKTHADRP